jgi:copper chaperone
MKQVRLTIEGMHCGGCIQRVTEGVTRAGAVPTEVKIGEATVQLQEGEEVQAVIAALEKMGFDAQVKAGGA